MHLLREAADNAAPDDAERLKLRADGLEKEWPAGARAEVAFEKALDGLMLRYAPRAQPVTEYDRSYRIVVDREKVRFSTWYEMFPRSTGAAGKLGSFKTAQSWLSYIEEMGFDVLYLPPIHSIGETHRKGRNNTPKSKKGDPGSPSWAVGSALGGHDAIHPELGTAADFRDLVEAAAARGIEVALDLAKTQAGWVQTPHVTLGLPSGAAVWRGLRNAGSAGWRSCDSAATRGTS